jgi:hypothetical protein
MAKGRLQFGQEPADGTKGGGDANFEIDKPPEIWKALALKVP